MSKRVGSNGKADKQFHDIGFDAAFGSGVDTEHLQLHHQINHINILIIVNTTQGDVKKRTEGAGWGRRQAAHEDQLQLEGRQWQALSHTVTVTVRASPTINFDLEI